MPKYRPTAEDEALYGSVKPPGAAPGGAPPPADPNAPPKAGEEGPPREPETTDEETAESENTAILPNKVLMSPGGEMPKEGDEIVLQVVRVYGDEAEVRYAPKKEPGPDEGPMSSDGEIDALDKPEMM